MKPASFVLRKWLFILLHAYEAESNHKNTTLYIFIKQYWLVLWSKPDVPQEITIFLGSSRTALLNLQSIWQSQLGKNILPFLSLHTLLDATHNGEARQDC